MRTCRLHHFRLTTPPDAPRTVRVIVTIEGDDTPTALDMSSAQAERLSTDLLAASDNARLPNHDILRQP